MNSLLQIMKDSDPLEQAYNNEFERIFLSFCSFVCIIHNKKMNLANIFILLMKEPEFLDCYMKLTEMDTKYDALYSFLHYDTSLHKSKYIKNFLKTNTVAK
jgi:hypothetical protein